MRARSFTAWGLLSLCLGLSLAPAASADTATMTRYFDEQARRAYSRLRYREALAYFLLVDRATPSANAAYNVAVTADAARDLDIEYTYLRRYLDAPDEDTTRREDATRRMAALEAKLALVTVETDPPGATVFVDQRAYGSYGTTPCTIVVEPGSRRILLELAEHEGGAATVEAAKGKRTIASATLLARRGTLLVTTTPPRASWVALRDGHEVATGRGGEPVDVPIGPYRVRIEPKGYRPEYANVVVRENAASELSLLATALPPRVGRLLLSTGGARGQLYVDGKPTASTPATLDTIPVGVHRLEIRAKGYVTWTGSVTVREGKTSLIEAKLRRSAAVRQ